MSKLSSIVGKEYFKAKEKHPEFPSNSSEGLCLIAEELGELAQAINDKDSVEHQIEEAAHLAVTALRFIEEKIKCQTTQTVEKNSSVQ